MQVRPAVANACKVTQNKCQQQTSSTLNIAKLLCFQNKVSYFHVPAIPA